MDFLSGAGKKRSNTGGIMRIFAESRREIGGTDNEYELASTP